MKNFIKKKRYVNIINGLVLDFAVVFVIALIAGKALDFSLAALCVLTVVSFGLGGILGMFINWVQYKVNKEPGDKQEELYTGVGAATLFFIPYCLFVLAGLTWWLLGIGVLVFGINIYLWKN